MLKSSKEKEESRISVNVTWDVLHLAAAITNTKDDIIHIDHEQNSQTLIIIDCQFII